MTSVTGDQSNVGFVLVNMRTKETKFYAVPGAGEFRHAVGGGPGAASGIYLHLPHPAQCGGPAHLFHVAEGRRGAGENVCLRGCGALSGWWAPAAPWKRRGPSYIKTLQDEADVTAGAQEVTGVIAEIHSAVLDGNTRYYFRLEDSDAVYVAEIALSSRLPFLKAGDTVVMTCTGEGEMVQVLSLQ